MIRLFRRVRGARTARPRARRPVASSRAYRPEVLSLEERQLLSATTDTFAPTDAEQYMLELINRARANPAAEGQRLVALAQTDPVLKVATAGWDLNQFLAVISSFGPEPPLAFNTRLIEAARDHNGVMLATNAQTHSPDGYLTDPSIARANDGQAYYPKGNGWWATGENIFAYSANVQSSSVVDYVNYFEAGFLLDWGNPDFGHLFNLLAPGPGEWSGANTHYPYSEIGIGLMTNVTPTTPPGSNPISGNNGLNVGPDLVTQEFGWNQGRAFLTGTFYIDSANTGAYLPGEGIGGVTVRAVGRQGQGVFTATTWTSGGYSLQLPAGTYDVMATGNLPYPVTTTVTIGADNVGWGQAYKPRFADQPVLGDYNGDHKTDFAVYRTSTAQWFVDGQAQPTPFGWAGNDMPLPGNYDGTGKTEIAVYRPSTAQWYALGPGGSRALGYFGWAGVDIPVPGDYDGVGYTEQAVYRPTTGQWFVRGPSGSHILGTLGLPGIDIPVPGNYDGNGKTEAAIYRPTTGEWYVIGPNGLRSLGAFGQANVDIPVPGDYDGVGYTEQAVYRPTTGQWFIRGPKGTRVFSLGVAGLDVPMNRGDFNGDGKIDPAVYRPSTGQWFVFLSGGGMIARTFGMGGASSPINGWISRYAAHPSAQVSQIIVAPMPVWGIPGAVAGGGGSAKPPRRDGSAHTPPPSIAQRFLRYLSRNSNVSSFVRSRSSPFHPCPAPTSSSSRPGTLAEVMASTSFVAWV